MNLSQRNLALFGALALLYVGTGFIYGWNLTLAIVNMGLISAVMALGVNMQWGYAGLFNIGIMGFVALGGLAVVLTSAAPVPEAWNAGGVRAIFGLLIGAATVVLASQIWKRMAKGPKRGFVLVAILITGFALYSLVFNPAIQAIEAVNPSATGYLGGLGLPVLLSWPVGGLLAAAAAWAIGKTALGLRSDYLAIATLGISEIIIAVLKNEDWLSRGVKNVSGLPRPVPYELDLQQTPRFVAWAQDWGFDLTTTSSIVVKLCYAALFVAVLLVLVWLVETAWRSPWGRMMRAIRDNETSAAAMGKNVTKRHLQIFVLGSAVCGMAGAMMTTLDGQLTPGTYIPLRFTFLIWVMVVVGGSGNNWGSILGAMLIWWLWVMVEPIGQQVFLLLTSSLPEGSFLREHLKDAAAHMRLLTMGVILLTVLRFSPRGLIPEK